MNELPLDQIINGDCRDIMHSFPGESVNLVMFSPPYWGLRNYGENVNAVWGGKPDCSHDFIEEKMTLVHENRNFSRGTQEEVHGERGTTFIKKYDDKKAGFCSKCGAWRGQLGLEPTYQEYIAHMVEIGREIKRVLRKDGSWYLNLGDTYATHTSKRSGQFGKEIKEGFDDVFAQNRPRQDVPEKCKLLIPHRVALALINDGWICRNDIVWYKPNSMPSSVKDRLTNKCEFIFHFVKSRKYYYDLDAIREPHKFPEDVRRRRQDLEAGVNPFRKGNTNGQPWRHDQIKSVFNLRVRDVKSGKKGMVAKQGELTASKKEIENYQEEWIPNPLGKNPGDVVKAHTVRHKSWMSTPGHLFTHRRRFPEGYFPSDFWEITTKPFPDAHFAVYPESLCERPIKSSCPKGGIVLDPFCGSGTTCVVAKRLGRHYIGIDLNPDYCEMARKRLAQVEWPLDIILKEAP